LFPCALSRLLQAFFSHRATAFAVTQFVQFDVGEFLETGVAQRMTRAVQGTAINDHDPLGMLSFYHERFDAPANAGEAGHLSDALL